MDSTGQPRKQTRGKGEGSVFRRGDGKWIAQVENGRSETGKRRYLKATRATKPEALTALRELQRQVEAGVQLDRTRSVGSWVDYWLSEVMPGTVKDRTLDGYRDIAARWIKPRIGSKRLTKLTPGDVSTMLRSMEADGLSPNSRRLARAVLRRSLAWAVQEGLVMRNVAALAPGPKGVRARTDDALTAEEAKAVLAQAAKLDDEGKSDRLEALAVLVLKTGLRRGEALALDWPSIDFDAGTFRVGPTLQYRRGHGLYIDGGGKTRSSTATLPLPAPVAAALKAHRRRQAEERIYAGSLWEPLPLGRDLVFRRDDGTALSPSVAYAWWRDLCVAAGVGPRRFHASRHTTATLLLDQGLPLEVVSAVLRHANLNVTADVYARPTQDAKRRALAKLDEVIGGEGQ